MHMNLFCSLRYVITGACFLNKPLKASQSSNKLRERRPQLRVPAKKREASRYRSDSRMHTMKQTANMGGMILLKLLCVSSSTENWKQMRWWCMKIRRTGNWILKLTFANNHKWSVQLLDQHLLESPGAYSGIQQLLQPALDSNLSMGCGMLSAPTISHQNYTHHTCMPYRHCQYYVKLSKRYICAVKWIASLKLTSRLPVHSLELLVPSIQATMKQKQLA